MKKTYTLIISLFAALTAFAQNTITYQANALREGDSRDLQEIEYKAYKQGGANQVWDYSNSKVIGSMNIKQNGNSNNAIGGLVFNNSDIFLACNEGPNKKTYFEITKSEKQYWGLESGSTKIEFAQPIIDMKFPFAFNDMVSGVMDGVYREGENEYPINGNYFTSADAFGKLLLPDGVIYDDVLRVKVEKVYEQKMGSLNYDIHTVRYQYFAKGVRYPVLIVMENEVKSDCNCTCGNYTTTTAYYHPQAAEAVVDGGAIASVGGMSISNIEATPNPFDYEILVSFTSSDNQKASFTLIGTDGDVAKEFGVKDAAAGANTVKLETSDVKAGLYTLLVKVGKETKALKLVKK
ncbi:MAG: T9SS type A sorting domain-containing protein [Paludibacteraceae bacterium]|jgi:hypothetical protein|nr:T9SS type A sorting domain-containing protein [Paludibacteraceae bacterium]